MESLLDVLRDVVDPAVRAVFVSDEVTTVELSNVGDGGTVALRLVVGNETFDDWVVQAGVTGMSHEAWRERLRSNLVDFVAESHFGWGQNRDNGPPT